MVSRGGRRSSEPNHSASTTSTLANRGSRGTSASFLFGFRHPASSRSQGTLEDLITSSAPLSAVAVAYVLAQALARISERVRAAKRLARRSSTHLHYALDAEVTFGSTYLPSPSPSATSRGEYIRTSHMTQVNSG